MIETGVHARAGQPPGSRALTVALLVTLGAATVGLGVASGGNVVATLAPALAVALGYAFLRVPLRWVASLLTFLILALEVQGDAEGIAHTPLVHLGNLLTDISGLETGVKICLAEVLLIAALFVHSQRRARGSVVDGAVGAPAPRISRDAIVILLAGVAFAEAVGLAQGHGIVPWKLRALLHPVLLFLVFDAAFPTPTSFRPIGVAVVAAGQAKALLAAWVQLVAGPELTGGRLAAATSHGDSILFAMAIFIALVPAMEGMGRRAVFRALLLIPLPLWGLSLNQRRIGWGMVYVGTTLIFLLGGRLPWRRRLASILLLCIPLIAVYMSVGWDSDGKGIFGPVHKVRTMIDTKVDPSAYWREVEIWNIANTIHDGTPLGEGLGGQYREYMHNDDISSGFKEYREWPHNSVLGYLMLGGVLGFTAFWIPTVVTVFLAARALRFARTPAERSGALLCIAGVTCYLQLAWGDTGAYFWQYRLCWALCLAFAGKLAVATGGWPAVSITDRLGVPA